MSYTKNTQKNQIEYIKNNRFTLIFFNEDGTRYSTRGNLNVLQLLHEITMGLQCNRKMLVFDNEFNYRKLFYDNITRLNDSSTDIEFYNKCYPYSIKTENFF